MDRRRFVHAAAGALACLALPALARDFWSQPRELWLVRQQTGEELRLVYFADGQIIQDNYRRICALLRDVRAGVGATMNPVVLDILCGVNGWCRASGVSRPFVVTSGYRTPATNDITEGAARHSEHTRGGAVDGFLPGVSPEYLARLGVYLSGGGVGWYPSRGFVHLDHGRLRTWRG